MERAEAFAGEANRRLARLSLRAGDLDTATRTLEQMISRGQLGTWPHVELAKICEHRTTNLRRALEHRDLGSVVGIAYCSVIV